MDLTGRALRFEDSSGMAQLHHRVRCFHTRWGYINVSCIAARHDMRMCDWRRSDGGLVIFILRWHYVLPPRKLARDVKSLSFEI